MEILWIGLKVLVASFAVATVGYEFYQNRDRIGFVWKIWKRFRPLMLLEVLGVLALTITVFFLLMEYIPFLKWGWWMLLSGSGNAGNVLIAPIMEGSESSSILIRIAVPLFFVALFVALPFLAKEEEEMFRRNHLLWGDMVIQSIKFGFIHLIVGVPIAIGIALSGVGFFYAYKYRKALLRLSMHLPCEKQKIESGYSQTITVTNDVNDEAILVATTYHTLYNSILIGALVVITLIFI